jgi:hypothetical protein
LLPSTDKIILKVLNHPRYSNCKNWEINAYLAKWFRLGMKYYMSISKQQNEMLPLVPNIVSLQPSKQAKKKKHFLKMKKKHTSCLVSFSELAAV